MAMILNPRVQAKAQAELDAVVGKDRLPSMADKPNLPYIRSIVTEVFRWSPAIPLSRFIITFSFSYRPQTFDIRSSACVHTR